MAFGVTTTGFKAKRTQDVKVEIENDLRATFGDGIDLSPQGPFGQIVGIFADRLGSIWSFMEQVYNSQYPPTASGTSFDNVASITGSVRKQPTKSKVAISLFGDVGTLIPAGSTVSVSGNTSAKFDTDTDATIVAGTNEVQRLTFPTIPEAGSFTLEFNGSVTSALLFSATAAQIKAALELLPTVGAGNTLVTGPVSSGQVDVEFAGDLAEAPQPAITVSVNALTSHEQTQITTVADVAGNLDRDTFIILDALGTVGVWIDVDDSGSAISAAALGADRAIEVTGVLTGDSANSVATAVAAALSADSAFSAAAVGNVITIDDAAQGSRVDANDVDTGFSFAVTNQGYSVGALPLNITEPTPGVLPQIGATATAQVTGPVFAIAGTLTLIETPVTGWASVLNALDADPVGTDLETDASFKLRRLEELAIAGRATTEAIRSQVLKLDLVTNVVVFENDLFVVDVDGRAPKSVDIVVENGDEDEIAAQIFDVVAAGIATIGAITKTVTDSQGFAQTIKFSRPLGVDIWVELDLSLDTNKYPGNGDDQVKAAIVAWGDGLGIGTDIIVHGTNSLEASIAAIPGITDIVIRVGKTVAPVADANIVIEAREVADFDTSRITVAQV